MWILYRREPYPDAEVWPGRRPLAIVDAIAWPALWMGVCLAYADQGGIVLPAVFAVSGLACINRLRLAWWANHRYRFTTWRWGRIVGSIWLIGMLLRLALVQ